MGDECRFCESVSPQGACFSHDKKVKKTIRILYRLFTYIYGTECTGPSGRAARPVFGDRLYRRSTQIKYTLPIKVHFTVPSMGNGIIRLYDIL